MKTLVAYFSASGKTKKAAEHIAASTESNLHRIVTKKEYPESYFGKIKIGRVEKKNDERPYLTSNVPDIDLYERVIIGFPIWFGTCPMAVMSFVEQYDFTGKDVFIFFTSGASGGNKARDLIKKNCWGNVCENVLNAGSLTDEKIQAWLKG